MTQLTATFQVAWERVIVVQPQNHRFTVVLCSSLKIEFLFCFLSHDKLLNLATSQNDSDLILHHTYTHQRNKRPVSRAQGKRENYQEPRSHTAFPRGIWVGGKGI